MVRRERCGRRRGGGRSALWLVALTLAATSLTSLAACGGSDHHEVSLVFAGSLIAPFDRLATEFERTHPGLQVTTEAHGSIQAIRQVTDLGRQFDLVVTADAQLIPPLMYDHDVPGTRQPFASWYVTFATNRMVLAISPKSPLAGQFTVQNWYKLLTRPGVRFGLADPRFDPAGYRALMVLQLAERYYHDPIIFENVVMGQFTTPVTVERQGQRDVIQVPEILETQPGSSLVLRDESIELDALLETGDLDCAFEYESVARQSGLQYVRLPAAIDLGEQRYAHVYSSVAVKLGVAALRRHQARVRGWCDQVRVHHPEQRPRSAAGAGVRGLAAQSGRTTGVRGDLPAADHAAAGRPLRPGAGGGEAGVRAARMSVLTGGRHRSWFGPRARLPHPRG